MRHKTADTNIPSEVRRVYLKGLARARGHRAVNRPYIGVAEKQRNGPTSKLNVGVGFRIGLENDQWLAERPWMKEGYD
jgi:hypothetical protein